MFLNCSMKKDKYKKIYHGYTPNFNYHFIKSTEFELIKSFLERKKINKQLPNILFDTPKKTVFSYSDFTRLRNELYHFHPSKRCNTKEKLYQLITRKKFYSFQVRQSYAKYHELHYSRIILGVEVRKERNEITYAIHHFDGLKFN